jgi:tetratricopeptide (TPR) repeat protein
MKAERRHELKQNTLAQGLETLPDLGRRHGTKILIVVMVGLAVALLIRSRVSSSREAERQAAYRLSHGRELIEQLQTAAQRVPPERFATVAAEISKAVDQSVQAVLESSDDPRTVAEARILQGDLNWQLAAMPEPPGATTRPELGLARNDTQLLQSAADAYQAALDQGGAPVQSQVTARLGLAAVAENQAKWDAAREQYQKVLDDPSTPKPLKDLAAASITRLETIRKPPLIAPATTPSTSTQPTSTQSAPAPTQPTTSIAPAPTPPPTSTQPQPTPQPTTPLPPQNPPTPG